MIETKSLIIIVQMFRVRGEYPAYAERVYQKYAVKDLVIEDLELLKDTQWITLALVIICRLLSMLLVLPTIQQMGIFRRR